MILRQELELLSEDLFTIERFARLILSGDYPELLADTLKDVFGKGCYRLFAIEDLLDLEIVTFAQYKTAFEKALKTFTTLENKVLLAYDTKFDPEIKYNLRVIHKRACQGMMRAEKVLKGWE